MARAPDVLEQGAEEPGPLDPRRLLLAALGAALVLAGAAALELRERQQAAQERRLAAVVDLRVVDVARGSTAARGRTASLQLAVRVRNDGPRAVTVLSGGAGPYGLTRAVDVAAGGTAGLLLDRPLLCGPTAPPPDPPTDALEVAVRAGAGVERARLPLTEPLDRDRPARACGFLPREQPVVLEVTGSTPLPDGAALDLRVVTSSTEQVGVLGARGDDGVEVVLREADGTPVALPRALPVPGAGSSAALALQAVLTVTDCTAARRVTAPVLRMALADDAGRVVDVATGYGPSVLRSLVASSC